MSFNFLIFLSRTDMGLVVELVPEFFARFVVCSRLRPKPSLLELSILRNKNPFWFRDASSAFCYPSVISFSIHLLTLKIWRYSSKSRTRGQYKQPRYIISFIIVQWLNQQWAQHCAFQYPESKDETRPNIDRTSTPTSLWRSYFFRNLAFSRYFSR